MPVSQHDGAVGGGSGSSAGWWPGLEGAAGKNEMDPGTVRQLANQLEDLYNDLTDNTAGTLEDLYAKSEAVTTNDAFGAWETGKEMAGSFGAAYRETAECYDQLRQQLAQAITTLRYEADLFEGVDAAVAGSFQYEQPGLGPGAGGPGVAGTPGMPG